MFDGRFGSLRVVLERKLQGSKQIVTKRESERKGSWAKNGTCENHGIELNTM